MWMIGTVIGLGIVLAMVGLYLLTCIRVLNGERSRYGKLILDDSSSLAMKEGCQEFSLARKLMR